MKNMLNYFQELHSRVNDCFLFSGKRGIDITIVLMFAHASVRLFPLVC